MRTFLHVLFSVHTTAKLFTLETFLVYGIKVLSMGGRELFEYGLPQPQAVDNDRLGREFWGEIDYNQGDQQAYVDITIHQDGPVEGL